MLEHAPYFGSLSSPKDDRKASKYNASLGMPQIWLQTILVVSFVGMLNGPLLEP